jgi:hypothetical protein
MKGQDDIQISVSISFRLISELIQIGGEVLERKLIIRTINSPIFDYGIPRKGETLFIDGTEIEIEEVCWDVSDNVITLMCKEVDYIRAYEEEDYKETVRRWSNGRNTPKRLK